VIGALIFPLAFVTTGFVLCTIRFGLAMAFTQRERRRAIAQGIDDSSPVDSPWVISLVLALTRAGDYDFAIALAMAIAAVVIFRFTLT
jgi:hypothetical protein